LALCCQQSGGQHRSWRKNSPYEGQGISEDLINTTQDIMKVLEKITYCIHALKIPESAAHGKFT
jgi:hypothetical protein